MHDRYAALLHESIDITLPRQQVSELKSLVTHNFTRGPRRLSGLKLEEARNDFEKMLQDEACGPYIVRKKNGENRNRGH